MLGSIALALAAVQGPPPPPPPFRDPFYVFFDWDSTAITSRSEFVLGNVLKAHAALPKGKILVSGCADRSGPAAYNRALGQKRAEAVAAYLRSRGVTEILTESFGEDRPLIRTPDGQREPQNRRAEIMFELPGD